MFDGLLSSLLLQFLSDIAKLKKKKKKKKKEKKFVQRKEIVK